VFVLLTDSCAVGVAVIGSQIKAVDSSNFLVNQRKREFGCRRAVAAEKEQRIAGLRLDFNPEYASGGVILVFNPSDVQSDLLRFVCHDLFELLLTEGHVIAPTAFSASRMRISPEMSLGRSVSRRRPRE